MSSQVDIANQALVMLGEKKIISFDDETQVASAVKTMYAPCKSFVLRSYDWNCSVKTVVPAMLNETPLGWDYAFAWPEDALRVIDVIDPNQPYQSNMEWEIEGKKIYTDVKNPYIRATFIVSEPELDAHVERTLVMALARDLSYAITADNGREQNMDALFEKALMEAKTTDAQERSHKVFRIDQLSRVRY